MEAPGDGEERRCPRCGALVSVDAEWCGQCFMPLRRTEPAPGPRPSTPVVPAEATAERRAPAWPCPTCGHENPIELDDCAVCGTSFAALMRSDERPPDVDPMRAFRRSLMFPGLGHGLVGRSIDGLARGVLFTVLAAMALVVLLSGLTSAVLVVVLALFAGMALFVYLGSAWEALRLAAGDPPFLSSRALLWATVAVVLASVALLALAVASATRR
ncbi:MAG: hypothetical protein M3O98_01700 [Actinomycetota bacterium]|nr:hypothetical protein [Actinomycetota bacterium]